MIGPTALFPILSWVLVILVCIACVSVHVCRGWGRPLVYIHRVFSCISQAAGWLVSSMKLPMSAFPAQGLQRQAVGRGSSCDAGSSCFRDMLVSFSQLDTKSSIHPRKGSPSWEIASIRWGFGQSVGCFVNCLLTEEGPAHCGRGHPWEGGPGLVKKEREAMHICGHCFSSCLPVPVLSFCPVFRQWWTVACYPDNAFPSPGWFWSVLYHSDRGAS